MAEVYRAVDCFFLRLELLQVARLYVQVHPKALKRPDIFVDANLVPLFAVGLDCDDSAFPERRARVISRHTLRIEDERLGGRFLDRLADRMAHPPAG